MNESNIDIKYLDRPEIDIEKWDRAVAGAANSLIYAHSVYLDTMAKNWSALVWNDYEVIMPLTWNRKFGISYLYQPAFTAQLGIFFGKNLGPVIIDKFLETAKSKFRFCEIHLNFSHPMGGLRTHANYILDLDRTYESIRSGYKKRLLENLQESSSFQLLYGKNEDYENSINLFRHEYGNRLSGTRQMDYQRFENLCHRLLEKKMIFSREARNESGKLMNSSIFLEDEHRIYNILSVTPAEGRKTRAHFFLLDQLIREFSSRKLVLDFEGSENPGIAEFYRKFGSVNQPYPFYRYNLLPFPLRLFK